MMAEYPWEIDGWEKRSAAAGLLEWSQEIADQPGVVHRYRIIHKGGRGWIRQAHGKGNRWGFDEAITDHEAGCLIFFDNCKRLAREGIWLQPVRGGYLVCREAGSGLLFYRSQGSWTPDVALATLYANSDEAQAAAIDAVLAEKGKADG